jgi:hypothetical protein
MASGANTSGKHRQHKVYPYLVRSRGRVKAKLARSTDVTYICPAQGFGLPGDDRLVRDAYCRGEYRT